MSKSAVRQQYNVRGKSQGTAQNYTRSKELHAVDPPAPVDSKPKLSSLITQVTRVDSTPKPISISNGFMTPQSRAMSSSTPASAQGFYRRPNYVLPPMSEKMKGRKTLVLDLDETLVHSSFQPVNNVDIVLPVVIEGETFYVYVLKRPGVDEFLEEMHKHYEIVIYTASLAIYADPLLDELDPNNYSSYRLFRDHCTYFNNAFVKDLSQLGRDLKDVIIVDNSPASYALQPENAVPILTWIDDPTDNKLYQLAPMLELLARVHDVRPCLRKIVKDDKINYLHAFKVLRAEEEQNTKPGRLMGNNPIVDGWVSSKEVEGSPSRRFTTKKEDNSRPAFVPAKPLMQLLSPPSPQSIPHATLADSTLAERQKKPSTDFNPMTPQYKSTAFSAKTQKGKPYIAYSEAELMLKRLESEKIDKKPSAAPAKRPASSAASTIPRSTLVHSDTESSTQKKALPHHQPRQAPKAKAELVGRPSTPQSGPTKAITRIADISGKKTLNPAQSKGSLFYSNLIKVRNESKGLVKEEKKPPSKPAIITSNGGTMSITHSKKPNKHSSSMGNADWLAGYDKLRKELNFNSPRDLHHMGRTASGSVKPKESHMLVLSDKTAKKAPTEYSRPLLRPGKANQYLAPRVDAILGQDKRTTTAKYMPSELLKFHAGNAESKAIPLEKNKFTHMLMQMSDGKSHPLISNMTLKSGGPGRRPVIATHNNFN